MPPVKPPHPKHPGTDGIPSRHRLAQASTVPLAVRLTADDWEYVRRLGMRDSRPAAYYVRLALMELVRKHKLNPTQIL